LEELVKKTLLSKAAGWLAGGLLLVGVPAIAAAQPSTGPQACCPQATYGACQPGAQQAGLGYPQGPAMQGQAGPQQQIELRGRVIGLMALPVPNTTDHAVLAVISTPQQGWQIAALGSEAQMSELGLQLGDRIAVQGYMAQFDGRSVLIGQSARSGTQQVTLQRSWSPQMLHQQLHQVRRQMGHGMKGMHAMQGTQGMRCVPTTQLRG
jgi:hypothetical protein